MADSVDVAKSIILGLTGTAIIFTVYFWPWLTALAKHHHNTKAILVLNLLGGWTVIGWVIAMVWAYSKPAAPAASAAAQRACLKCGRIIDAASRFCAGCGQELPT